MRLDRYHGLGNDYFVLDASRAQVPSQVALRTLCHRHLGWGSDGLLWGPSSFEKGRFGLRIFNADGSEAEKSGNGLRIFARYLYDQGLARAQEPFQIQTLTGTVEAEVLEKGALVRLQMGRVSFKASDIPFTGGTKGEVIGQTLKYQTNSYTFCAGSLGNPHLIIFVPKATAELAQEMGALFESFLEWFPQRANVHLVELLNSTSLKVESFERGVGYTLACGSGCSVAAAAAKRLGLCQASVVVFTAMGQLDIEIGRHHDISLRGPVTRLGKCEVDEELWR